MRDRARLLRALRQELERAERAPGEEAFLRSLYAVQALCELELDSAPEPAPELPRPAAIPAAQPLEESGANGSSLFDF